MIWVFLIVAIFVSGLSFPFMLIGERATPNLENLPPGTIPRLMEPGYWFHDTKNLLTEACRHDAQWFSKALAFIIVVQLAINIYFLWRRFR